MIQIYCDGSSLGNPGPSGYASAAFLEDSDTPFLQSSGGKEHGKNGEMEVYAFFSGLYLATKILEDKDYTNVKIFSDSMYVVNSFGNGIFPNSKGWMFKWAKHSGGFIGSGKEHPKIWEAIYKLSHEIYNKGVKIETFWIKAHAGHSKNEYVDQLARSEAEKMREKIKDTK